jgi:hypothetical protein
MKPPKSRAGLWDQLYLSPPNPASDTGQRAGRKFLSGKPAVPSQISKPLGDRAVFGAAFARQLDSALCGRARELEALWDQRAISAGVKTVALEMFSAAIEALKQTRMKGEVGAPAALSLARALRRKTLHFEDRFDQLLTTTGPRCLPLAMCLRELCDGIHHYAQQMEIVFGIVSVKGGKPVLTNRPTNRAAKEAYGAIVSRHQLVHGPRTFPKPRQIRAALSTFDIQVSDRTLRDWKQQIEQKTFDAFVQPRKRQ